MNIIKTPQPDLQQKEGIYRLWNNEYPAQLAYQNMGELDSYLNNLTQPTHYFVVDNNHIMGWAFTFQRNEEKWFAIIVDTSLHKQGVGSALLNKLKEDEDILNGWVTDHYRYLKSNGDVYLSPLQFYLKNEFRICRDIRLEFEKLSAVKIQWVK